MRGGEGGEGGEGVGVCWSLFITFSERAERRGKGRVVPPFAVRGSVDIPVQAPCPGLQPSHPESAQGFHGFH